MDNINKFEGQNEYSDRYSEKSLFSTIKKFAQKAGISVVYAVLLLYYALQKTGIPAWAKASIVGSLGYFIVPVDAILDPTPVIGYADDLGVLIAALVAVAIFIDNDVKTKARNKLKDWFGEYDESLLNDIDSKIHKKKEKKHIDETDTEG